MGVIILITLWGMMQYDKTLLSNLPFPTQFEYDDYIRCITDRCGELFPYFQNPDQLKISIQHWARRRACAWNKIVESLFSEYNPIENYDRIEEWSDSPDLTTENNGGSERKHDEDNIYFTHATNNIVGDVNGNQINHSESNGTTQNNGSDTEILSVSAFDQDGFSDKNETVRQLGTGNAVENRSDDTITTLSHNSENNDSDIMRQDKLSSNDNDTNHNIQTHRGTTTHKGRIHGNIGVTTTQQMIQAEIDLQKYDFVNGVAIEFEEEFMLQIY